jgi:hypothetical protein
MHAYAVVSSHLGKRDIQKLKDLALEGLIVCNCTHTCNANEKYMPLCASCIAHCFRLQCNHSDSLIYLHKHFFLMSETSISSCRITSRLITVSQFEHLTAALWNNSRYLVRAKRTHPAKDSRPFRLAHESFHHKSLYRCCISAMIVTSAAVLPVETSIFSADKSTSRQASDRSLCEERGASHRPLISHR